MSYRKNPGYNFVFFSLVILIVLVMLGLVTGCTDEGSSRKTLRNAGYSNITFTGWSPLVCGQDDMFSTGFTAKNPTGQIVSGTVCCGLVAKGCTIRF